MRVINGIEYEGLDVVYDDRLWVLLRKGDVCNGPIEDLHLKSIKFEMPENLKFKHSILKNTMEDAALFYNNFLDIFVDYKGIHIMNGVFARKDPNFDKIQYYGKFLRIQTWEDCTIENYKKRRVYGY